MGIHSQSFFFDLTTLQPVHIAQPKLFVRGGMEWICGLVWHIDFILNSGETLAACALIQDGLKDGSLS
jgi:hypothetical protein